MTDDEVLAFVQDVIRVTSEEYVQTKRVVPAFYLIGKDIFPIYAVTDSDADKMGVAAFLRYQAKLRQPRAILAAQECWMVEGIELPEGMKPSQHPAAIEVLYFALEDIRLGIRIWMGRVYGGGKRGRHDPILPKLMPNGEHPTDWEGTFTGLLSPDNAN